MQLNQSSEISPYYSPLIYEEKKYQYEFTFFNQNLVIPNALIVEVCGQEYIMCTKTDWWCSNGKQESMYQRGVVNTLSDPKRAERAGCLGEMAFAKVFKNYFPDICVKLGRKTFGDKVDFVLNDITVDVKTTFKPSDLNCIEVKNLGAVKPISCDVYVSACVWKEDLNNNRAKVVILGWQTGEFVKQLPLVGSRKPGYNHQNKELFFKDLKNINQLKTYCKENKKNNDSKF